LLRSGFYTHPWPSGSEEAEDSAGGKEAEDSAGRGAGKGLVSSTPAGGIDGGYKPKRDPIMMMLLAN